MGVFFCLNEPSVLICSLGAAVGGDGEGTVTQTFTSLHCSVIKQQSHKLPQLTPGLSLPTLHSYVGSADI